MIKALGKDFDKTFKTKDCDFKGPPNKENGQTILQIFQFQNIKYEDENSFFHDMQTSIFELSFC